ncbi:MAG: ABC transporter substrate-binding protein [Eubacteriales bacterium]|nr:ABC transporter substrate-binding protein [Eubacteriales bacterium]
MKRWQAGLMALFMSITVLTGCGKQTEPSVQTSTKETERATEKQEAAETVTVTDMNGRSVEIPSPEKLTSVYYASPLGQLMIYSINPKKMAGIVSELRPEQKRFLPETEGMGVMGNFDGGKSINTEEVLASGAQVFISMGPMVLSEKSAQGADELQEKLNIPVLVVNGRFEARADAFRFLGTVFGEEDRCEMLAQYCEETLSEVEKGLAKIPDAERVSLYYAEGENGLATEPESSSHAAVFKFAGAKNVAAVELTPGPGRTPVTLEQILAWDPDVIFMGKGKGSPYAEITSNPDWSHIKAVKEGRVYEAPNLPFSWIDRPPSVQQYLGLRYVAQTLYPDYFNYDLKEETKRFFKLFFNVNLTDEEAAELLGGTAS